jgi:hypothetical protein
MLYQMGAGRLPNTLKAYWYNVSTEPTEDT